MDVLKVLSGPEYTLFSKALTEANLVDKINSLNAVTVFPLSNAAMGTLAGKSPEALKATLMTHVLPGYYDDKKLVECMGSQTPIETLYQSSGLAQGNQGYIKVQLINEGEVVIGSAAQAPGTVYDAGMVQFVAREPEVISAIELTKPIAVPGIDNLYNNVKLPLAALTADDAMSPSALAPSPAPSSSDASRLCMGLLAAASASAAFILAL
ncbi:hypothetical protein VNO80_18214 [Phaseolus coccineus]|uniref:FAS1 domain-containing protein n=1 Tax=Phaseolus coccineus TaxID=3886 RepID=A0AAN9MIQ8_PHACN